MEEFTTATIKPTLLAKPVIFFPSTTRYKINKEPQSAHTLTEALYAIRMI
jgi:hypothetical protein